jgi:hypothetical protein
VTDIYSAYNGKDAKGHPLDDERAIRRYFEPSLVVDRDINIGNLPILSTVASTSRESIMDWPHKSFP